METDFIDVATLEALKEKMSKERILTEYQAWALQHSMLEISYKAVELINLMHEEILPATRNNDDERLYGALITYGLKLWELQSFRYITMARKAIDKATVKLSDKLYPDED